MMAACCRGAEWALFQVGRFLWYGCGFFGGCDLGRLLTAGGRSVHHFVTCVEAQIQRVGV